MEELCVIIFIRLWAGTLQKLFTFAACLVLCTIISYLFICFIFLKFGPKKKTSLITIKVIWKPIDEFCLSNVF